MALSPVETGLLGRVKRAAITLRCPPRSAACYGRAPMACGGRSYVR
jgi:hypothetical protein